MVWLAAIQAGINMKIQICYSTKQTRKCQLEWQSSAKGELGEKTSLSCQISSLVWVQMLLARSELQRPEQY